MKANTATRMRGMVALLSARNDTSLLNWYISQLTSREATDAFIATLSTVVSFLAVDGEEAAMDPDEYIDWWIGNVAARLAHERADDE